MKRALLHFLLPATLLTLALYSCKKGDEGEHNTVTPGAGYTTIDQALATAAPIAKTFSVVVPTGDTFYTVGGARVGIPRDGLETMTGVKVTGSVQVTFNDWQRKGDMVFGKVLPLNYGQPLISGGQVYLSITQNGQAVRVRKGYYINVWLPQFGAPTPFVDTIGYVGRDIIGASNIVNWLPVDTNTIKTDFTSITDTVMLRSDTLGYLAAGVPLTGIYNKLGTSNFTVKVNAPVVLENTMAIASYDALRALYPLIAVESGKISAVNVPTRPMHIAVMGVKSGTFYAGVVAVAAPASDSVYTVTLKAMAPATFKLQLDAL